MASLLVCISFFFKAQKHWECLSRKASESRSCWPSGVPLFTGWSGNSDVWVCRATPHGLAGRTPPIGSGQWTAFCHHPDCTKPRLHHLSTVEDTHTRTHMHIHIDIHTHKEKVTHWAGSPSSGGSFSKDEWKTTWPNQSEVYLQVKSESVWFSACGTVTVQMSLGCFGCPSEETLWKGEEGFKISLYLYGIIIPVTQLHDFTVNPLNVTH